MNSYRKAITKVQAVIIAVIVLIAVIGGIYYYYVTFLAPTSMPEKTIKIGLILPLSGASARLGKEVLDGAMLAFEEINDKGGVLGRKIELIVEDDEGNPDKCLSAAKKLIEFDKVDFLAGVLHSSNVQAISEYVASVGIPYVSPISSGPTLVYKSDPIKFKNFFTIHPYYDDIAKLGLAFLTDVVKAKNFIYVGETYITSQRVGDYLEVFAKEKGIQCLDKITVPIGAKDFTEVIMKLKEANPDAVVSFIYSGAEVTFARQLFENKVPFPYYATMATLAMWETPELLGEASEYQCFGTWSWNVSITEKTIPFYNKFYEKYGYRACGLEGPAGYDLMYFIAAALEKAGTLEWNAVIKAIGEVEVTGVRGKYKIDPTDHGATYWAPGYINGVIGQWKNGKPYVIWPPEMVEKSFEKAPWMS